MSEVDGYLFDLLFRRFILIASPKSNRYIMFIDLDTLQTVQSIKDDHIGEICVGEYINTDLWSMRTYKDYESFLTRDSIIPGYTGFYTCDCSVAYYDGNGMGYYVCSTKRFIGGSHQVATTNIDGKMAVITGSPPTSIVYDNEIYHVGDNSGYITYIKQFVEKLPPIIEPKEDPIITTLCKAVENADMEVKESWEVIGKLIDDTQT